MRWCSNSNWPPAVSCAPSQLPRVANSSSAIRPEHLAEEARPGNAIPPRFLGRLGNADAHPLHDIGHGGPRPQFERRHIDCEAVMSPGDLERLAQAARSGAQEPLVGQAPTPAHGCETSQRPERPDQYGTGTALFLAHEVEAPVDAVGAVHVRKTRGTEHDGIALRRAPIGMRGRVGMMIRLELDDFAADAVEQ